MVSQVQKKKGTSLKWGLIGLICACWIMPIVLILLISSAMIRSNLERQIADVVSASAQNAIELSQRRIESIMEASKKTSYDTTIRDAYNKYQKDGDHVMLYDTVTKYLLNQYRYEDHFKASCLFFVDQPDVTYYVPQRAYAGAVNMSYIYREQVQPVVLELYKSMGTEIRFFTVEDDVYMIRNIVDRNYKTYAVFVNELSTDAIFQNLSSVVWLETVAVGLDNVVTGLADYDRSLFYNTEYEQYDKQTGRYTINTVRRVEGHTVWYSLVSNGTQLLDEMPDFRRIALLIVLLSVPLLILMIGMFTRHVTRPVEMLIGASRRVTEGEMGYQMEKLPSSREFHSLTEQFNLMSSRLKQQFERIFMEQRALQDSRIKALQSQINPHFLNNTLEIINWEARMCGNKNISDMIEALSTMLNAAMARDDQPTVPLEEELAYVDAYLYIIAMRYGKRLKVERELDESLLGAMVPRLIMQPIVENAIEHGVASHSSGAIVLRVYSENGLLCLEVENDSPLEAADEQAINELLDWSGGAYSQEQSPGSIGIRNVNERIKILYGPDCGLSVSSSEMGTLAKIVLPDQ
ncbi:sensor histidine kinase [Eubacteriales bacterium OttesenSCG-928-K08]|nr:sensor histidine kinase [Eubacteriales bacterium OttesenSCG-928-K08]